MAAAQPTTPARISDVRAEKLAAGLRLSGRTERLIALARVLLAIAALLAFLPGERRTSWILPAFGAYLTYSVGFAAVLWSVKAPPGWWSVATHVVDFAAVLLLMIGPGSDAYQMSAAGYVFLVVCGTLRWQWGGNIGTAGAALTAVAARPHLNAVVAQAAAPGVWPSLPVIAASIAFIALVIGYMGAYHRRFTREMVLFAEWPNKSVHDARSVVTEILHRAALVLNARAAAFVWTPPGRRDFQFAQFTRSRQEMEWDLFDEAIDLHQHVPDYICDAVAAADPRCVVLDDGHLRETPGLPLGDGLRARLRPSTLIGCLVDGQEWQGRLLIVDKPAPTLDDLLLAKIVARLGGATLDQHYLIEDLQQQAADQERVGLARDLHDGFLQTLAALALQLHRLERVLESEGLPAAQMQIREIQKHLSHEHESFSTFIQQLKPGVRPSDDRINLAARLHALAERLRDEWQLNLTITVTPHVVRVPSSFAQQVQWLLREALVNAARHAMASQVVVEVVEADQHLDLVIADNGRGFPFRGRRDAGDLAVMRAGPRSLRERVAALAGALLVDSREDGATLRIRLPIPPGA